MSEAHYPIVTVGSSTISLAVLREHVLAGTDFVKADVDVGQKSMIVGMPLHVDGEQLLLREMWRMRK